MTTAGLVFDIALVATVLWLAVRSLASDDLFRSIVSFIVFGFMTALSWTRLAAPDIALADAVIGAGITGALLLDAFAHFERHASDADAAPTHSGGDDHES